MNVEPRSVGEGVQRGANAPRGGGSGGCTKSETHPEEHAAHHDKLWAANIFNYSSHPGEPILHP